jgi:hypothetical protein
MANPWVVIPVTVDGDSVQEDDFSIYLSVITGINEVPAVRGADTVVPGRAGRSEGNRINDVLTIVLAGVVMGTTRAIHRTRMRSLRTLFASNRSRMDIVAVAEDGSVWTISARPMNIVTTTEIEGVYWEGSVELEGYDDWSIAEAS